MKSHVLSEGVRVSVSSRIEGCAVSFDFEGHPAYVMGGKCKGWGDKEWVALFIGSHPDDDAAASAARTHHAQLWISVDALEELVTALRQSAATPIKRIDAA